MLKHERGEWQVVRWCCTSGLCSECHGRGNHGDLLKRARVVQLNGVSEGYATAVAANWRNYGATAEAMPVKEQA